jgi:hypothetical protein
LPAIVARFTPEEVDRAADLRDAHVPVHVRQRLERRIGVVADGEDRGASAAPADRLGHGHGIPSPAGEDADRLPLEAQGRRFRFTNGDGMHEGGRDGHEE